MHRRTYDYRKEGHKPGTLVDRGFWLTIPRPILICRLLGHRPVVDGCGSTNDQYRWVACDRCGIRPEPQGTLDPARFNVGAPWTGLHQDEGDLSAGLRALQKVGGAPGPWPKRGSSNREGTFGGQLILGKSHPGWSAEIKIGNMGSEHTLAAHLHLHPLGAIYLHAENFRTWLQRRLNPTGWESRVAGISISLGHLSWTLWAKRNESSRSDPWWMRGRISLDPRDRLFGPPRYSYEDIGEPVTTAVRMPHGDDHQVVLKLQRCDYGRRTRRRFHSWTVDWDCRAGIGTKAPSRGRIMGSAVEVSADSVTSGTWAYEAAIAIAAKITTERTKYGYRADDATANA